VVGLLFLLSSCIRFQPKPISPAQVTRDFETRALNDQGLEEFLKKNQLVAKWPLDSWDLKSLTMAAFYFHPDLDVARAQWAVSRAGVITAGERPNPSLNLAPGYNSTTPVSLVTPWIPTVNLDIPIEIAGKRGYRISQARHLSESARLNITAVAWQVRSRLRRAMLGLYASQETEARLSQQQVIQAENSKLLELQQSAGEVSAYEVTQARIALDNVSLAALDTSRQRAEARVLLADALGLPVSALEGIVLSFDSFGQFPSDIPASEVRRQAVLNRADILGALAEYAATQAALQLEIARQYPDISIGPGYQLDQTDNKWTLGLTLTLPIFSRNRGPIAEAEARRTESASRCLALQARVNGEIERAVAACRFAVQNSAAAESLVTNLKKQEKSVRVRYEAGEISKLELAAVQLELISSSVSRLEALIKTQEAFGLLEDAMQRPFDLPEELLSVPRRNPER
jgi:outer membrane protein TolC